jgi:ADP-ribose pyrophosphatase YjhB (NUDIX family)
MNIPISSFSNFKNQVPSGDSVSRMVCDQCEWIHYDNPRVIVTGLCTWQNQVLLCRRAIAPRYGFWTLPGGFMEIGETIEEGACREVREEAGPEVDVQLLLATYSVTRIGQVHMIFHAAMRSPEFEAGQESIEVQLFPLTEESIPWDDLAFPVNAWALRDFLSLSGNTPTQPFTTRPEHRGQRMAQEPFHPDFPPPHTDGTTCGKLITGEQG